MGNNIKKPDKVTISEKRKSIQCEEEIVDEVDDSEKEIQLGEVNAIGTALEKYLNVISTYKEDEGGLFTGNQEDDKNNNNNFAPKKRNSGLLSVQKSSNSIRKALSPNLR